MLWISPSDTNASRLFQACCFSIKSIATFWATLLVSNVEVGPPANSQPVAFLEPKNNEETESRQQDHSFQQALWAQLHSQTSVPNLKDRFSKLIMAFRKNGRHIDLVCSLLHRQP